ncbi:hypothetical protein BaRGS_00020062 [Batillaria attramentaria]|uniref:RNA helicase n=1 Tax=Batillaria attramentaria TaxID=370345 RepID=A0ABD0KP03_9CAEN
MPFTLFVPTERVSSIEMQPPDRDDEAETSEHDASASSSRSDSGDTVVEKLEGFMATADKLERVREQRTEQFVHDVNAKLFRKTVTRGLVDDDCSISVFSETATISTTSDNNPAANLPPFVPRTGGILQQDEVERLRRGEITLRPYQEELLVSARNGSNVLINLPTGTGKTYLVLKYAQEVVGAWVLWFLGYDWRSSSTRGSNTSCRSSSRTYGVGKPLGPAVEQGHVSLSDFSLLVLDECHHARGGHPLRNLMNLYMDLKFSRPAGSVRLPQIMGLTASPGVGRAQGGDAEKALDYLLHLCARLDVQEICTVRDNKDDLAMYAHEPKHELHQSGKRKKDKFKDEIEKFMKDVETLMCTHEDVKRYTHSDTPGKERLQGDLGPPVSHRGDSQYTEWAHGLENRLKEVTSGRAYYVLMACAEMLKLLQRALILNEDCESWYALDFLKKEVERRRAERPETASVDHDFYNKFTEQVPVLEAHCNRGSSPRNPKLRLLKKLILKSTSTQDTEGQDLDAPTPDGSGFNIQATAEPDPPGVDVATDPQETLRKTSSIPQPQEETDTQNETSEAYAPFQYHGHNIISRPWISLKDLKELEKKSTPGHMDAALPNMGREQILDNARWIAEQESSQTTLKQFLSDHCEVVRERQDIGQEDQATGFSETELNRLDEGKLLNDGTQDILRDADDVDLSDTDSEPDSEWNWALDKDVRGMIFVRTLDLSKALVEWIKQDPKLCHLNPGRITGVNASVKDGGMTKSEVTDVMSNFNAGHHKLVVCTSAAEEGLDFTACNLVIRYDYVTSMVSMIQTRGRARQKDSRYCVMGDLASGNKAKEEANLATESLMHDAVARFQKEVDKNLGAHLDKLARMQKDAHKKRWSPAEAEARRDKQKMPTGFYKLLCGKCQKPACTSRMIRLLKKTNRVVIGSAFSKRYERRDGQKKKAYDKDIPPTGTDLHCKHCGNRWGIFVRSVADNIEFPVITIRSFLIHDEKGEVHIKEKWSQAFDVPNLTEEDRETHVQANGSALDDEEERVINNADEEDLEREGREQVLI